MKNYLHISCYILFIIFIVAFIHVKNVSFIRASSSNVRDEIIWEQSESLQRSFLSNSVILNDRVYVIGGVEGSLGDDPVDMLQDVYFYQINNDGSLTTESISTTKIPQSFIYSDAVANDNKIFVIGGQSPRYSQNNPSRPDLVIREPSDILYCAEINPDGHVSSAGWQSQSILFETLDGDLESQRITQHKVVVLELPHETRMFLIGGMEMNPKGVKMIGIEEVYSAKVPNNCSEQIVWEREYDAFLNKNTFPNNPTHVASPTVTTYQTENGDYFIYLLGGLRNNGTLLSNEIYRAKYNLVENKLENWEPLPDSPYLPDSMLVEGVVTGKYLYLIGGNSNKDNLDQSIDLLIRGEFDSNGYISFWEPITSPVLATFSTLPELHGHDTVVSDTGQLYVVNGSKSGDYQNHIYWTPLVFFDKQANLNSEKNIEYTITVTSNNVKDLGGLQIIDDLSDNTRIIEPFIHADPFIYPLNSSGFELTVGAQEKVEFTVTIDSNSDNLFYNSNHNNFLENQQSAHQLFTKSGIQTSRTFVDGRINSSTQAVFGPEACATLGQPFPEEDVVYTYRISIPHDFPYNLRVEIFDPDTANSAENEAIIKHSNSSINLYNLPESKDLSCEGFNSRQTNPCILPTGEHDLENKNTLDEVNPFWILRVDENRQNNSGICSIPENYNVSLNTPTIYELYSFSAEMARQNIARYQGQTDIVEGQSHGTDLRWVSPGASSQGYDYPVDDNGQHLEVPTDFGSFEIPLSELQNLPIVNGERFIFLDVYAPSGSSENGYEIWAGPDIYTDNLPSDVNERNLAIVNGAEHDSNGVHILSISNYLSMNSIYPNVIEIPLIELNQNTLGKDISIRLYDADNGAEGPLEFFIGDNISSPQENFTFPNTDTSDCFPECNGEWIDEIVLSIPGTICPDNGQCLTPDNQILYANYHGGKNDTVVWEIIVEDDDSGSGGDIGPIKNMAELCGIYEGCIESPTVIVFPTPLDEIIFLPIIFR